MTLRSFKKSIINKLKSYNNLKIYTFEDFSDMLNLKYILTETLHINDLSVEKIDNYIFRLTFSSSDINNLWNKYKLRQLHTMRFKPYKDLHIQCK